MQKDIVPVFKRYSQNPILTPADLPLNAGYYVFNPGAVKIDGEYILLVDVFHMEGSICFWLARSRNGYDFKFDPQPVKWPEPPSWWPENGCYDPRITQIGDDFFIMYGSHVNDLGTRLGIVKTRDFTEFEFISIASEINNRNGVLFPEKINGMFCRMERPFGGGEHSPCDMWLSYSPDLIHWGQSRPMMQSRSGHFDGLKIGGGSVPIRVDEGWLIIYHGVTTCCSGSIYSLFTAILDADDPTKILNRSKYPVLFPQMPYETTGRVLNVVFTCNSILEPDGMVKIYYGAADSCIGLAEASLKELIASTKTPYHFMTGVEDRHDSQILAMT